MRPTDRPLSLRGNSTPVPLAPEPPALVTLAFDDNKHASLLFGLYDQNLAKVERKLGVVANALGNQVTIKGPPEACEQARRSPGNPVRPRQARPERGAGRCRRGNRGARAAGLAVPQCRYSAHPFRADQHAPARHRARPQRGAGSLYPLPEAPRARVSPKGRPEPARPGSRSAMPSRCSSRASSSG